MGFPKPGSTARHWPLQYSSVHPFQRSQTRPELPHPELTPSNTSSETRLIYSTRGSPLSISAHPHTDRVSQHCTNFRRASSGSQCHVPLAGGQGREPQHHPWQGLRADPPSSRAAGCLHSSSFCHYIMKSWHYREVISWRSLSNSRKTVCPHLTSTVSKLGVGKVLITNTQHGYFMLWDTIKQQPSGVGFLTDCTYNSSFTNTGSSHLLAHICTTCLSLHCSISFHSKH